MSFNLATILTEATLAAPDAPVCRIDGNPITYRELDDLSGRAAAGLRETGLSPGQVVALQLPNGRASGHEPGTRPSWRRPGR